MAAQGSQECKSKSCQGFCLIVLVKAGHWASSDSGGGDYRRTTSGVTKERVEHGVKAAFQPCLCPAIMCMHMLDVWWKIFLPSPCITSDPYFNYLCTDAKISTSHPIFIMLLVFLCVRSDCNNFRQRLMQNLESNELCLIVKIKIRSEQSENNFLRKRIGISYWLIFFFLNQHS